MKGYKTGRPGCDKQKLLKVILFAFMGNTRFFRPITCSRPAVMKAAGYRTESLLAEIY